MTGAARARQELRGLRSKLEETMNADELRELAKMGKAAMNANLLSVRPIANGFLMDYDDVEEFDVKEPIYPPARLGQPGSPQFETRHRWRIVRKEVYCADAEAIKTEVDRALELEEKVKRLKAEGVLAGEEGYGTVVGMA